MGTLGMHHRPEPGIPPDRASQSTAAAALPSAQPGQVERQLEVGARRHTDILPTSLNGT